MCLLIMRLDCTKVDDLYEIEYEDTIDCQGRVIFEAEDEDDENEPSYRLNPPSGSTMQMLSLLPQNHQMDKEEVTVEQFPEILTSIVPQTCLRQLCSFVNIEVGWNH